MTGEENRYHLERAAAHRAFASQAASDIAARAHLKLAELHEQRAGTPAEPEAGLHDTGIVAS